MCLNTPHRHLMLLKLELCCVCVLSLMLMFLMRVMFRPLICTFLGNLLPIVLLIVFGVVSGSKAYAQIERPDRKYLFLEDKNKKELKRREKIELQQKKQAAKAQSNIPGGLPFDINATSLSFNSAENEIIAEGDVIISYSSIIAEALRSKVDIDDNKAELIGDVRISDIASNLTADYATVDFDNGSGFLKNVDLFFDEGDYKVYANEAARQPGDSYILTETELTTCQCPEDEDCRPWSLHAANADIEVDGYGTAKNVTLKVHEVPVFYLPYLIFPVKTQRQSGLLSPTFGGGQESGFALKLPFFWAINKSSDMTITGVYESDARAGVDLEYRRIFSREHTNESGLIYLNESLRNERLLGTNVDDFSDPTFDENRFAAYIDHSASPELGPLKLQFLLDANYVSDDLLLREYEKDKIARYDSRFVTSRGVLRTPIADTFSLELSSEFNQAIVDDDDFVLQRLPELNLAGVNTFRTFGENPYGLKLVLNSDLSAVNFDRKRSYDGARFEAYESLKMPFHYRNYFEGSIVTSVRGTIYDLQNKEIEFEEDSSNDETDADSSESENSGDEDEDELTSFERRTDRVVPALVVGGSTVVEKVFNVPENSLFRKIVELGRLGRSERIVRLKHTVEPGVKYKFVPSVDQSENPQFDSTDRLAQRNVVTYSLTQRLFGRFDPRNPYIYGLQETTPEPEQLSSLRSPGIVDRFGTFGFGGVGADDYQSIRRGSIVELASLQLSQSFDVLEDRKDRDEDREPFSDMAADLQLYPNEHVRLRAQTDYDLGETDFSSYTLEGHLSSKRGDSLRSRLRSVKDNVRQLESSAELVVSDRLKLGYYTRYDDLESEFIEQKAGIRISSACKCWVFDVSVADKNNPDETKFEFNITLVGLGEIGNTFFETPSEKDN